MPIWSACSCSPFSACGRSFRSSGRRPAWSAAVPLFWATPRTGSQWELGINARGRAATGLSEGPVDLNTTGPVTVNRERAFEVYAEDEAGRPFLELSSNQRWRVYAVHNY